MALGSLSPASSSYSSAILGYAGWPSLDPLNQEPGSGEKKCSEPNC